MVRESGDQGELPKGLPGSYTNLTGLEDSPPLLLPRVTVLQSPGRPISGSHRAEAWEEGAVVA